MLVISPMKTSLDAQKRKKVSPIFRASAEAGLGKLKMVQPVEGVARPRMPAVRQMRPRVPAVLRRMGEVEGEDILV